MFNRFLKPLGFLAVIPALLITWNSINVDIHSQNPSNECISPEFPIAFPYRSELQITPTPFPMPASWVSILESPYPEIYDPNEMIITENGDFWLLSHTRWVGLLRITKGDFDQIQYNITTESGSPVRLSHMVLSKQNILWVFGSHESDNKLSQVYIAYYDPDLDKFQPIPNLEYFSDRFFIPLSNAVEDNNGNFLFVMEGSLMQFDPISFQLSEIEIDIEKSSWPPQEKITLIPQSIVLDDNNQVWMIALSHLIDSDNEPIYDSYILLSYNLVDGNTKIFGSPPGMEKFENGDFYTFLIELFIDHDGKIWVSNYGWLEIKVDKPVWYKLVQSPIFITSRPSVFNEATNYIAFPMLEKPYQHLWFASSAGIARLDLQSQEWCLVNTLNTSVLVEDENGDIWTAGDGQIYKYSQQP